MKLLRLSTRNFRGCPDGSYSFAHPTNGDPLPVVLITGGSGSGKTSLLEAVAAIKELVGAYGRAPAPDSLLRGGATEGALEASWLLSDDEAKRAKTASRVFTTCARLEKNGRPPQYDAGVRELFKQWSTALSVPKLEYFPSNRRIGHGAAGPGELVDRATRLGKAPHKYDGVARVLIGAATRAALDALDRLRDDGVLLGTKQEDAVAPYRAAFARFAPHVRLRGIETRDGSPRVIFERRDGGPVELDALSDSESQGLLFAVTALAIGLQRSVLLIDTPELHVASGDQLEFFRGIVSLGSDNQIIATTTSEALLRDVHPHQIVTLGSNLR